MENSSHKNETSNISGTSMLSRSSYAAHSLLKSSSKHSYPCDVLQGSNATLSNRVKDTNTYEKVNEALLTYQQLHTEYLIREMILHHVSVVLVNNDTNDALDENLLKKLKQVVGFYKFRKNLLLHNNADCANKEMTLAAIRDLHVRFNTEEKIKIKRLVEKSIYAKTNQFISRYRELGGDIQLLQKTEPSIVSLELSDGFEPDLLQWREKCEQACSQYKADVFTYRDLLGEWVDLKYGNWNDLQFKKVEKLLLSVQVSKTKADISKLNAIVKMYNDTPLTITAFRSVALNLDSRITELKEKIQKAEITRKLYYDLKGTEYDKIVKTYTQLQNAIEKRKYILKNM